MYVLSTWFGDICGSRKDLYVLQKVTITLYQLPLAGAITETSPDRNSSNRNVAMTNVGSHNVKNGTAL